MLLDEHSPLSLYIAIAILTGLQCIYFLYIYFARRQLASTLSVVLSIVALLTTVPLHFHHWLSHHPSTDAENSVLRFTLAIQSLVQIILEGSTQMRHLENDNAYRCTALLIYIPLKIFNFLLIQVDKSQTLLRYWAIAIDIIALFLLCGELVPWLSGSDRIKKRWLFYQMVTRLLVACGGIVLVFAVTGLVAVSSQLAFVVILASSALRFPVLAQWEYTSDLNRELQRSERDLINLAYNRG